MGWRGLWPHGALLGSPWVLLGALQPFTHCLASGNHSGAEDFSREVVDLDPECGVWLAQGLCASWEAELSDSLQPHELWPARLLCPWDSPGKNTGVGCHFLLQGIPGSTPCLLHCRQILCPKPPGEPFCNFTILLTSLYMLNFV